MSQFEDVGNFMRTFGQPVRDRVEHNLSTHERLLRVRLVVEEAMEFAEAMGVKVTGVAEDLHKLNGHSINVEIIPGSTVIVEDAADALADSLYVVFGSAHTLGLPMDDVFAEVHRSNMAKADPVTGLPNVSADGKVLKPNGWTPPDIAGVLRNR